MKLSAQRSALSAQRSALSALRSALCALRSALCLRPRPLPTQLNVFYHEHQRAGMRAERSGVEAACLCVFAG